MPSGFVRQREVGESSGCSHAAISVRASERAKSAQRAKAIWRKCRSFPGGPPLFPSPRERATLYGGDLIMTNPAERRRHPRVVVDCPVVIITKRGGYCGERQEYQRQRRPHPQRRAASFSRQIEAFPRPPPRSSCLQGFLRGRVAGTRGLRSKGFRLLHGSPVHQDAEGRRRICPQLRSTSYEAPPNAPSVTATESLRGAYKGWWRRRSSEQLQSDGMPPWHRSCFSHPGRPCNPPRERSA